MDSIPGQAYRNWAEHVREKGSRLDKTGQVQILEPYSYRLWDSPSE